MKGHVARKRFGQNFLVDRGVIAAIVATIAPQRSDTLVEIGPGLGALTEPLLARLDHLHVVEIDRDLIARLHRQHAPEMLTVHAGDALAFDFATIGSDLRLVGNLPYNISTPLLFHLAEYGGIVRDMHFMLQKEVVERMAAEPGGKDYGRLSVMLQARCAVIPLFTIGPGAFRPPPKVESAVVRLVPLARPPDIADPVVFARLVAAAFAQRRKTLRNGLKGLLTAEAIAGLGVDPGTRAEQLGLDAFVRLANAACKAVP